MGNTKSTPTDKVINYMIDNYYQIRTGMMNSLTISSQGGCRCNMILKPRVRASERHTIFQVDVISHAATKLFKINPEAIFEMAFIRENGRLYVCENIDCDPSNCLLCSKTKLRPVLRVAYVDPLKNLE